MSIRRTRPRKRLGARKRRILIAALIGVAAVILGAVLLGKSTPAEDVASYASVDEAKPAAVETTSALTISSAAVEVPDLTGMPLADAQVLLGVAGFVVRVEESGEPLGADEIPAVESQQPAFGQLAASGDTVTIVIRPKAGSAKQRMREWVVCIDPGHQARSDQSPEPIGPGAETLKQRISAGVTGVETGMPESEVTLQIAMNLKSVLEQRGLKVVMTRTTNDVNISNQERALIANKAEADLFIRIHAQGHVDSSVAGVEVLYPAQNRWTKPIAPPSKRAAEQVRRTVLLATNAPDAGLVARSDLAGFNWSKVPAILVGCGYLSNPVEDRLLVSPHYQDKLAQGMADGIIAYLEAEGD